MTEGGWILPTSGHGQFIAGTSADVSATARDEVQAIYHDNRGEIVTIALNVALSGPGRFCELDGTALPGN